MSADFWEQYKHPEWQKKRLECLEAAAWECQECGATDQELHVHHPRYIKGRMAWEYENTELQVLCETCHKAAHKLLDAIKYELALAGSAEQWVVLGYLQASSCGNDQVELKNHEHLHGVCLVFGLDADLVIKVTPIGQKITIASVRAINDHGATVNA